MCVQRDSEALGAVDSNDKVQEKTPYTHSAHGQGLEGY